MLCMTWGLLWQAWTQERTAYLGVVLSKMLQGYTNAAVTLTSGLISAISHFAVQVGPGSKQTNT